jgi:hypothetical protein
MARCKTQSRCTFRFERILYGAWNSLPPQDQAIVVTAGIDAVAGAAVAADALSFGAATPLVDPLVGAAISATVYTASSGGNARWQGALGAAAAGAVSFGVGSAVAGAVAEGAMSQTAALFLNEGATVGANLLQTDITAGFSGHRPQIDGVQLGINIAFAAIPGLGDTPGATLEEEPAISLGSYGNLYAASSSLLRAGGEQMISTIGSTVGTQFVENYAMWYWR